MAAGGDSIADNMATLGGIKKANDLISGFLLKFMDWSSGDPGITEHRLKNEDAEAVKQYAHQAANDAQTAASQLAMATHQAGTVEQKVESAMDLVSQMIGIGMNPGKTRISQSERGLFHKDTLCPSMDPPKWWSGTDYSAPLGYIGNNFKDSVDREFGVTRKGIFDKQML